MTASHHQIAERYLRLALASEQHIDELIDAYFGPADLKQAAHQQGKQPIADLLQEAKDLIEITEASTDMPAQRREHLLGDLNALYTSLRLHNGEKLALAEEAQALYGITPTWVSEDSIEEAQLELDTLLPGDGSLYERVNAYFDSFEVSLENNLPQLDHITRSLRKRTHRLFQLPESESFELTLVHGKPWGAFNRYMGNYRSLIEISAERPISPLHMAGLLAHEGYPGHHTELAIKEEKLIKANGWNEFSLVLTHAPSALIAEGLAMQALYVLIQDDELIPWLDGEVFPLCGKEQFDASRAITIQRAYHKLNGVTGNAAFMLLDQDMPEEEVIAYLQRYRLVSEEDAQRSIRFTRFARAYTFLYNVGADLVDQLLKVCDDRITWFSRLLTEPVSPSQLIGWISRLNGEYH